MASAHKPAAAAAADDLDDLDDILDEFNKPAPQPAAATAEADKSTAADISASQLSTATADVTDTDADGELDEEMLNEQFARELAQGMEALMKGMNPDALAAAGAAATGGAAPPTAGAAATKDAGAAAEGEEGLMNEDEMMKQFEQMMAEMGFGGATGGASAGPSSAAASGGGGAAGPAQPPANFQDAIRNTMSRLRQSDETATSSAGQNNDLDLEKLMAAFGNVEGAEGEEGIASMLENMMSELMSKEVLYDPLKELRDKYPAYLANPPAVLSAEDRARYENQQRIVTAVIVKFDDPKFENGTEAEKKALKAEVQTLMNEMQDSGAPPQEIIGDLPPELEGMPGLGGGDENCTVM